MEAIIRTKDKNAFNSLVQFLKSLHFEVETKEEKKSVLKKSTMSIGRLTPMTLEEFYERNQQSQKEIATGHLVTQGDVKKHFARKSRLAPQKSTGHLLPFLV